MIILILILILLIIIGTIILGGKKSKIPLKDIIIIDSTGRFGVKFKDLDLKEGTNRYVFKHNADKITLKPTSMYQTYNIMNNDGKYLQTDDNGQFGWSNQKLKYMISATNGGSSNWRLTIRADFYMKSQPLTDYQDNLTEPPVENYELQFQEYDSNNEPPGLNWKIESV